MNSPESAQARSVTRPADPTSQALPLLLRVNASGLACLNQARQTTGPSEQQLLGSIALLHELSQVRHSAALAIWMGYARLLLLTPLGDTPAGERLRQALTALIAAPTTGWRDPFDPLVAAYGAWVLGQREQAEQLLSQARASGLAAAAGAQLQRRLHLGEQLRRRDPRRLHPRLMPPANRQIAVKKIAFYLPQFHPIPENDEWWEEGFTEWNNVARARPLFPGHWQPRRPGSMGYYDLRVPATINKQIRLAQDYGIDAFCFYYYWFNGTTLLDTPLQLLMSEATARQPFCICWVNEPWTRGWDGLSGEILMDVDQSLAGTAGFLEAVAEILRHPDYLRLNGKAVLLVYCPQKLENPQRTLQHWRAHAESAGIGELHLCAVQSFGFDDPIPLGFDAAVEFPPHCIWDKHEGLTYCKDLSEPEQQQLGVEPSFGGILRDYNYFADCAMKRPDEPYPLYRSCMLAWDNTARRQTNGHIYLGFSTQAYQQWLACILDRAQRDRHQHGHESMVFINAWNEWAEGCTLEPDQIFGHALLRATQKATLQAQWQEPNSRFRYGLPAGSRVESNHYNLIVVGHDAHPFGAQTNLLSMVKVLKRKLQHKVHVILLQGGELAEIYRKTTATTVFSDDLGGDPQALQQLVSDLARRGFDQAILNTTIAGQFADLFQQHGMRTTCLIHELPALIRSYNLEPTLAHLCSHADELVFSSTYTRDKLVEAFDLSCPHTRILAQGINFNPFYGKREHVRLKIRRQHQIPHDAFVVMGCGYADFRKGIDIFVRVAQAVIQQHPAAYFLWVGALAPEVENYIHNDIRTLGIEERLLITGSLPQPFEHYLAADAFALTSREDPLPSVVMEAFDAGLPVVGFASAGGFQALLEGEGAGRGELVGYLDEAAMAAALLRIRGQLQAGMSFAANHDFARRHFSYDTYLRQLLSPPAALPLQITSPLVEVSVIVPNYNYHHFLGARLQSILKQSHPPREIIVLDDASRDGSIDFARHYLEGCTIPYRILANTRNSGSVARQWKRGLDLAQSAYVWIAEADDYCEPTMLGALMELLHQHQAFTPSLCFCDSWMVDDSGTVGSNYATYHHSIPEITGSLFSEPFILGGHDLIFNALGVTNTIPNASACLIARQALQALDWQELQSYRWSADWITYLRLVVGGAVAYTPTPLNYHRRHAGSVVHQQLAQPSQLAAEAAAIQRIACRLLPDPQRARELEQRCAQWQQRTFAIPQCHDRP